MTDLPKVQFHTTSGGLKYFLISNDAITHHILEHGSFEPHLLDLSSTIISKSESSNIILDIGANVGTYSIPLAKKYPEKYFCAFEPLTFIHEQLCKNVNANKLTNLKTFNIALGNEECLKTMMRLPYNCGNVGANSLSKKIARKRVKEYIKINPKLIPELVQIKKLDQLKISGICLIKLDVEGFELNVLKGAVQTLKRNKFPPVMFETWMDSWYDNERKKLISLLKEIGYNSFLFLGSDNIAFKDDEELFRYGFALEKVI